MWQQAAFSAEPWGIFSRCLSASMFNFFYFFLFVRVCSSCSVCLCFGYGLDYGHVWHSISLQVWATGPFPWNEQANTAIVVPTFIRWPCFCTFSLLHTFVKEKGSQGVQPGILHCYIIPTHQPCKGKSLDVSPAVLLASSVLFTDEASNTADWTSEISL